MAKAKNKGKTATLDVPAMPERRRTVSLDFPSGETPEGFDQLTIGGKTTIKVTGTINRLTQEKEWGASLAMDISKVELI